MSFKIVVDSCCDLTPQMKKEPCFVRVPMTIQVDDNSKTGTQRRSQQPTPGSGSNQDRKSVV